MEVEKGLDVKFEPAGELQWEGKIKDTPRTNDDLQEGEVLVEVFEKYSDKAVPEEGRERVIISDAIEVL